MVEHAIVFDTEFLTAQGAPQRFWCGPLDPDPVVVQIGAVKLHLTGSFEILDRFRVFVRPIDRHGNDFPIDPFFSQLTGIARETIIHEGKPLVRALAELERFAQGEQFWSWGKDELNLIAISCYVTGIDPMIPASRFDNACKLLLKAGMPLEDVKKTRSNQLADYFGIAHPPFSAHDALDDALSVAHALQHLLQAGALCVSDFTRG